MAEPGDFINHLDEEDAKRVAALIEDALVGLAADGRRIHGLAGPSVGWRSGSRREVSVEMTSPATARLSISRPSDGSGILTLIERLGPHARARDGSAAGLLLERWLAAVRSPSSPGYESYRSTVRDAVAGAAYGRFEGGWTEAYAHPPSGNEVPYVNAILSRGPSNRRGGVRTFVGACDAAAEGRLSPALAALLRAGPKGAHVQRIVGIGAGSSPRGVEAGLVHLGHVPEIRVASVDLDLESMRVAVAAQERGFAFEPNCREPDGPVRRSEGV